MWFKISASPVPPSQLIPDEYTDHKQSVGWWDGVEENSYWQEAKKMKSQTIQTHGCLRTSLRDFRLLLLLLISIITEKQVITPQVGHRRVSNGQPRQVLWYPTNSDRKNTHWFRHCIFNWPSQNAHEIDRQTDTHTDRHTYGHRQADKDTTRDRQTETNRQRDASSSGAIMVPTNYKLSILHYRVRWQPYLWGAIWSPVEWVSSEWAMSQINVAKGVRKRWSVFGGPRNQES